MVTCTPLGMTRPRSASTFFRTRCATEMAFAPGRLAMLRVTAGSSVKLPAAEGSEAAFPLTSALSPGEREPPPPVGDNFLALDSVAELELSPPLPEGEGRGEGERDVRLRNAAPPPKNTYWLGSSGPSTIVATSRRYTGLPACTPTTTLPASLALVRKL